MDDQRERVDKMTRSLGMSSEAKATLAKAMDAQTDWTATCRKCGEKLTGTMAQIREHHCGTSR